MKPSISQSAIESKNAVRNACEALAHAGLKAQIAAFKSDLANSSNPQEVFEKWFEIRANVVQERVSNDVLTLQKCLMNLSSVFYFWSRNGNRMASNTELRAWIENGNVSVNGYVSKDPNEVLDYPVMSLVLFKGGKTQLTIF